jgi:hypothetical protein
VQFQRLVFTEVVQEELPQLHQFGDESLHFDICLFESDNLDHLRRERERENSSRGDRTTGPRGREGQREEGRRGRVQNGKKREKEMISLLGSSD